jgi:sugar/nucleoside kinase (ribokinase family)
VTSPVLVCCGLATLDVVQRVERVPAPDEKLVAQGLDLTFGGPAANAAATAAALGVPTVLVTALGSGPVARLVRDGLVAAGVRVVDLAADAPGDPPVSTVLVTASTGQRAVVSTNATLRPDDLGEPAAAVAEEVLRGPGAVLVDGHHLAAGVAVASVARRLGIPVLADGGSWKPGLQGLLALVDVAILSADLVVPGPPGDVLAAVAALGPSFVARSAGAGPVRVRLPSGASDEVTPPVVAPGDVVDTLGAGDVLHGGAAAALARGLDPLAALREGVALATESVRHPGALGWVGH